MLYFDTVIKMENTIIIDKILLHMLDMEHSKLILSNELVAIDEALIEYYRKKVEKVFSNSNIKELVVGSQHHLITMAKDMLLDEESFITTSAKIADDIFNLCTHIQEMPNSNLMFVECKVDGVKHILVIKLNYKVAQTTKIVEKDGSQLIEIVTTQSLPTQSANVDEVIIINTDDGKLSLIEKRFNIDGKPGYYLNEQYIKGEPKLSDKQKISLLNKAVKKVDSQFNVFEGDPGVRVKHELLSSIQNFEKVKPMEIAKRMMEHDYQAQSEVETLLNDLGIENDDEIVNIPTSVERMGRCKLVLDDERVIEMPLEDYLNMVDLDTEMSSDGTTSLTLKNILDIKVK